MAENKTLALNVACAAFFAVAGIAAVVLFLHIFAPLPHIPHVPPYRDYDRTVMEAAMTPEAVAQRLAAVDTLGSRAPGQPGNAACADLIRAAYRGAGLDVLEQELDTVHPGLERAAILDENGKELPLVMWPFMPNQFQPAVTPPQGLRGRVVRITDDWLEKTSSGEGVIAVVDIGDKTQKKVSFNPVTYMRGGYSAVLLTNSAIEQDEDGNDLDWLSSLPWQATGETFIRLSLNFPRAVVEPAILDLEGRTVTLHLRSRFAAKPGVNIVGILSCGKPEVTDALVVPVAYDGFSVLPDHVPGTLSALQVSLQLQLLEGLVPHRDALRRDVIFVACGADFMAQNSQNVLLQAVGRFGEWEQRGKALEARRADNAERARYVREIEPLLSLPGFMVDPDTTLAALAGVSAQARRFFADQQQYAVKTIVLELSEVMLQARIAFEKSGGLEKSPEFTAFRAAKIRYDRVNNRASYNTEKLLSALVEDKDGDADAIRRIIIERFAELARFHDAQDARLAQSLAINARFLKYRHVMVYAPMLNPAAKPGISESVTFGCFSEYGEHATAFNSLLGACVQTLPLPRPLTTVYRGMRQQAGYVNNILSMPHPGTLWAKLSYPTFVLANNSNSYNKFSFPISQPLGEQLPSIASSMQILGEVCLSLAYGNGTFPRTKYQDIPGVQGSVFAQNVGSSVVPNFPVAGAVVTSKRDDSAYCIGAGYYRWLYLMTDPYGRYEYDLCVTNLPEGGQYAFSPVAAAYDGQGVLRYFKDEGLKAQNVYKSIGISGDKMRQPVNVAVFRCTPVAILDRVNPQTLKEYADAAFLAKKGLAGFESTARYRSGHGMLDFLPPEALFYVALQAGSPENEIVRQTRAVMLNTPDGFVGDPSKEIDGLGYLAQETPVIRNVPGEVARSMAFLNEKRIALQERYDIADDMTLRFRDSSREYLEVAKDESLSPRDRGRLLARSVVYSTLNHPVIRGNISEAVWGILWYMGLLVPFIFFFEKLVFGFPDIRKQLIAQGGIFLLVFFLLQMLHPAFEMIRSSVMILLGFIIILISGGITFILSGKFKENLEALQQSRGQVKGATGNTIGIVITAFLLGLNNMHRRKVRTGLTCATLVLLTFVMICFTSVQSNIVDRTTAVAKAPYQGFLVKNDSFEPVTGGEVSALASSYNDRYAVAARSMYLGLRQRDTGEMRNPEIQIVRGEGDDQKYAKAKSCLFLSWEEPLRDQIRLLGNMPWFTEEQHLAKVGPFPVMIPERLAAALQVTPEEVAEGPVEVKIMGEPFLVCGIFEAESLQNLRDLDGVDLLPFDVEGLRNPKVSEQTVFAEPDDPRIDPEELLIGLYGKWNATVTVSNERIEPRIVSVAIDMRSTPYKIARMEVDSYLEQTGKAAFFGLERIAYMGKRARESSMTGLVDLLIPLLIAALTVLNTMKGSVYERRDEIFVYNAVGIAPRYVFFMFMAEALVYVVVGSLLGYILSQGTGRVLTTFGWTGGIKMNFTSLSTVYVSLTIAAAVLLSTLYPAWCAVKIAEPAEDSGWKLPEPEGDVLSFELPFTFTPRDRIAVLAFFKKYLDEHGEGSAGAFFAGPPRLGLSQQVDPLQDGGCIPMLSGTVWLKPFDLGVSQRMDIALQTDPDTREFVSRITLTRISGTRESWLRLNHPYVTLIRRHFLHWRAASEEMKQGLYGEARAALEARFASGDVTNG